MKKLVYFTVFICFAYCIAWFFAGQYGKKIISDTINNDSNTLFSHDYKNIKLAGFPYKFNYTIKDLKTKQKSLFGNNLIEVSFGDINLSSDLFAKNLSFFLDNSINLKSSDGNFNINIGFKKLSSSFSFSKSLLFNNYDSIEDLYEKINSYNVTLEVENLTARDTTSSLIMYNLPKLYIKDFVEKKNDKETSKITIDLITKNFPLMQNLSFHELSARGNLILTKEKDKIKHLKINNLVLEDPFFEILSNGVINNLRSQDISGSVETVFGIKKITINNKYINLKTTKPKNIFHSLFLIANGQKSRDNNASVKVKTTFKYRKSTFGRIPLYFVPSYVIKLSSMYDTSFKKIDQGQAK